MGRAAMRLLSAAGVLAALAAPVQGQATVEWTVMVYLNGDNNPGQTNLENASIRDFNELEQIGSSQDLNLVVQWDRNPGIDDLDTLYPNDTTQSWTTTRRYLVIRDPNQPVGDDPDDLAVNAAGFRIASPQLLDIGEADMGQEDTLVNFVQWSMERFPARRYMLVLNDTGRGWQPRSREAKGRGIIFDASTSGDAGDTNPAVYLTNVELRTAMQRIKALNGNRNLDVLAMDAGGMGIIEIAHQLRDTVDYVVAQFLDRPLGGFPYDLWMSRLQQALPTAAGPLETMLGNFAGDFTGAYVAGTNSYGGAQSVTVGVYNMANLAPVVSAANDLATALIADLPTYAPSLLRVLAQVQTGRPGDFTGNHIDLAHFAALCTTEFNVPAVVTPAAAVGPLVDALVVNNSVANTIPTDHLVDNFTGLGVYFPRLAANLDPNYSLVSDFPAATAWDELVQGLLTLFSDLNGPVITIVSPVVGATIIENPPTIQATIIDPDAGGRINAASIRVVLDGVTIPSSAYTFDANSGTLVYQIPAPLTVNSHTFSITARDLSGNETTANGNFRITVPTLTAGVQTFSLPRQLTAAEADPTIIFGRDNFTLVRWVPSLFGTSKYRVYPDTFASFLPTDAASTLLRPTVTSAPAGLGYWVRLREDRPVPGLPGTAVTASEYRIQLSANPDGGAGWNLIANPFDVAAVGLASAFVELPSGRRMSFRQAIEDRVTPGELFTYVRNPANPNATGSYSFAQAGQGQLTRLAAHWLRANQDCTLIFAGASRSMVDGITPALPEQARGGWQATLVATSEVSSDQLTVGANEATRAGYDPGWDVAGPPSLPGAVALRVVNGDWGLDSGRYVRDLRGLGRAGSWDLELSGPAGEVVLTWPDLRAVPSEIDLVLTDLQSGVSRRLRTTAAYRVSHDGEARALRLTVEPTSSLAVGITQMAVQPGRAGGWTVSYALSRAADVRLVVTSFGGRALAQVAGGRAAGGVGELYWDGRGADGSPLPNGLYQLELTAQGPDGSLARQRRLVRVVR